MIKTKRNKVLTLGMTGIALSILLLLCVGIYPALRLPSFSPRAMYGFGVLKVSVLYALARLGIYKSRIFRKNAKTLDKNEDLPYLN